MAVAWQCPDGLTFDSVSRYAGCNVSIGFAQIIGWSYVVSGLLLRCCGYLPLRSFDSVSETRRQLAQ
jgi:hypothetical protein